MHQAPCEQVGYQQQAFKTSANSHRSLVETLPVATRGEVTSTLHQRPLIPEKGVGREKYFPVRGSDTLSTSKQEGSFVLSDQ